MEKTAGRRTYQKSRGQKTVLGEKEKRRLGQLGACLVLFVVVFFAKGTDRLGELQANLTRALQANVDFQAVFTDLGWSIASGRPVGKTLNSLWSDVFIPSTPIVPTSLRNGPLYLSVQQELRKGSSASARLLSGTHGPEQEDIADPMAASGAVTVPQPEPTPEPSITYVEYNGPALPDNTTMDRYALGLQETVSPVMGHMTSPFGWRDHPIEGGEKFHCGVDLKADTGTPVLAFASGTVDYIGESDVYGQYLQLRHENGVTSFYAHCSKLCVQQGQSVAAGEKVAESGATGEVTGPHLHFEMRKDGVRLNPAYYIDKQP